MGLQVIGAGFGRTGTLSLKNALELLGFDPCYHMLEVVKHPEHAELWRAAWRGEDVWDALFDGEARYRAGVDWPVSAFWPRLMAYYPQAKVLLSVRDADSWYTSATNTIFASMKQRIGSNDPETRARSQMAKEIIYDGTFGGDLDDRARCVEIYEANVARVHREVPADRLIVFDARDGWGPLCAALGVAVPDVPYPHVNTTEEFAERWRRPIPDGSAEGR